MKVLDTKDIVDLFENFLNESGQWSNFKEWIEDQGYKLEEFGMEDDE